MSVRSLHILPAPGRTFNPAPIRTVEDNTVNRPSPNPRRLSAFTLFDRLLALPERLAGLFRRKAAPRPPARLALEAMEERLVPDGRPLPFPVIFAGAGAGHTPVVRAYDAETGNLKFSTTAYEPSFRGGVRVGTGDITLDGIPDLVTAPGRGHAPRVKVFDGATGQQLAGPVGSFLAYSPTYAGGVHVAAADINGDGRPDVVTAAVTAGGPRVRVFSGADASVLADFTVPGAAFRRAVTVAAADLTHDGKAEVVVGAGPAGGGWVRTYDPLTGTVIAGPLGNFRSFGPAFPGGVFVGSDALAGDVNADGTPDLAVGTGPAYASRVRVFSGATGEVLHDFLPFGPGVRGGARTALAYVDDDPFADVVVGSGPGTSATVRVFNGVTGEQLAAPLGQYAPFGNSQGGVFVAATNDPAPPTMAYYFNGLTSTPTLVAGQVFAVHGTATGGTETPTGTITFELYDSSSNLLGSWVQTLTTTTPPQSATTPFALALAAGSYTMDAQYSGDSNYAATAPEFTILSVTVTAPSNAPAHLAPGGGGVAPDLLEDPAGAGGQTRGGYSAAGVNYKTGSVSVGRSDLSSAGYGSPWGLDWSWTSAAGYGDGTAGGGATTSQTPHLVQVNNNDVIAVVSNGTKAHFFDKYGGAYNARHYDTAKMTHDTGNAVFVVKDGTGQVFTFHDFTVSPAGKRGRLQKVADAEGNVTEVTSWDSSGRPLAVERTTGTGSALRGEKFVYAYITSGTNLGLLETVTRQRKVGTGDWTTVRSTAYTYHDGTTSVGKAGELRTAVVKDAAANTVDTSYYRYYTTGSTSRLKFAFGPDAYRRLTAALGTSVDSLTDAQVDDYADKYVEYDSSSGQVTLVVDAAAGCSVCTGGQGEFEYTYTANSSFGGLIDPNRWANKVVETLPDGSTNTVYTNASGQVMLEVFDDAGASGEWRRYYRYDSAGRTILEAGPSAVTGYSESNADLVGYSGGNATHLDDDDGLVTAYTYASSTTATTSTPGDAAGYLKQVDIKHGETGTAIPQSALTYIKRTANSQDFFFVASSTVYRNDNGTGGQTTTTSYTWQGTTAQPESVTTTLPTVTTAQNGSNSATSVTTVFDEFDRPVWSKDQAGSITYTQYDTITGAVVKTIADVDTDLTGDFTALPSGWSSPSGLHLITAYEVDALGRVTKSTSPEGRVDYTVYDDDNHEVRHYPGWNTTTDAPTGPTTVSREDLAGGYSETLTMSAAPSLNGSDLPTGGEAIGKVQSLSRSYVNAVGQVTHTDVYFDLNGLTYSTSTSLGTEGTHFYRIEYAYDNTGQQNRTETHLGTISRTVHDGQGRVVSEWVGTDDTPTSGFWSPTNTAGTNLVKVREYEYDGGGVGDGNVTKVTAYPGGSAAARVTQTWYDWRNRGVAVKQGVEGTESTSLNRPLVYRDYDNLGQVTKTRVYDADTVTPTITDDVPQPLSASLLRAQTTTSFDELGRVYRAETHSVNPSDGTVGSNTLKSDTWFDSRGLVIKTVSPGGLVQKVTYDGVGRATTTYMTDGGGDSGYSDADDVTGDIVLEQSETTFDDDGLPLVVLNRVRFHDASGTGALGSPTSGIGARVSYAGNYYDASSGRLTATVDVGTNGGSSWTRPGSVPSRSDTELVTSYSYAADAVQVVKLTGNPTGGTFTLTFGGQTTSGIAYNASAATVDSALEALSSVGSGNVVVTAAAGGGWQVRFAGSLAGKYQAKMTASGAGLTGGSSPSVAVSTLSAGGDTGNAFEVTDPKALVSRTYADAMGRTTATVENYVDGAFSDSDDKTTLYTYSAAGMTSLTAVLTGGVQTTEWVFGVTSSGSTIDSNDIVGATRWPDPSTGAASGSEQEAVTVNALGQTLTATDRNGSVHTLTYDVLGRVVSDAVTTLGSGVDGSVRRIETAYDGQGNAYLVTSYDAASGGNVVNQVQREFNGVGQMTKEWQAHSGSVNTSTSPKVEYAYSEMASGANHSRLTTVTYPNGRTVTWDYGTNGGLDDKISRLAALKDGSTTLEGYSYLGVGTVVVRSHPQPGVDLTYAKRSGESNGDAGDQYIGLDRFGRVVDQRWVVASSGTATDRFQYAYDRNGNRTATTNTVNTSFNETYGYDNLNQLTSFARGSHTQSWDLDAVGNFEGVTTDGGSPVTRTHNRQNELTQLGSNNLAFDANGNTTTDETGKTLVYDAWNRLVAYKNGSTTLVSYQYDGLNRRVVENPGTARDLYYSASWQVLEERVSGTAKAQYVWSPVYVDALVLRDRDADGNGGNGLEERFYVQQDGNWNITAIVTTSGTVSERAAYDAYGKLTVMNASWTALSGSGVDWVYYYQGARRDGVSGNDHLRRREYDSDTMRFLQVDPIRYAGGNVNLYGFVGNEPINRTDPSGLVGTYSTTISTTPPDPGPHAWSPTPCDRLFELQMKKSKRMTLTQEEVDELVGLYILCTPPVYYPLFYGDSNRKPHPPGQDSPSGDGYPLLALLGLATTETPTKTNPLVRIGGPAVAALLGYATMEWAFTRLPPPGPGDTMDDRRPPRDAKDNCVAIFSECKPPLPCSDCLFICERTGKWPNWKCPRPGFPPEQPPLPPHRK
jgi:RHS repeat-associated protein